MAKSYGSARKPIEKREAPAVVEPVVDEHDVETDIKDIPIVTPVEGKKEQPVVAAPAPVRYAKPKRAWVETPKESNNEPDDEADDDKDEETVEKAPVKAGNKNRVIMIVCGVILLLVALGFGGLILFRSGILSSSTNSGSTVVEEDATQDAEDMQRRLDAIAAAEDTYAKEEAEAAAKDTADATKNDDGTVVVPDGFTEHVEGYAINEGVADDSSDTLTIKGELINLTGEKHGPCAVGYYLYDLDGNVLGFANVATDELDAGKVWKFTATSDVPSNVVHRFELADVRF